MTAPLKHNLPRTGPYKVAAVGFFLVSALVFGLVYVQFRGGFTPETSLTLMSARAGLTMDPGSAVTYNGVRIGRVSHISETEHDGKAAARLVLEVNPKYVALIPTNVKAAIVASTVFGNKYVSLTAPKNPAPQRITTKNVIDATSVTTEVNTLFQSINDISEKIDPIKLNLTLSATAQALSGLGDKFGQSLVDANTILDDVNPRMPRIRRDIHQLATLFDVYAQGAPDFVDALDHAIPTVRTLRTQEKDLDATLLAAVGAGNTGADILDRGGPHLQRAIADLVPTSQLLDAYSPELYCVIRNYAELVPKFEEIFGNLDASALKIYGEIVGPANPYAYPENLPRVNAHGGAGGAPGCWQKVTHTFWPAPYVVFDDGASIAPYNHFEVGSPWAIEYVWGRQVGDTTINP